MVRCKRKQLIGQLLVKKNLISLDDLGRGLTEHRESKCLLGEALVKIRAISKENLYRGLSEQFGVDYVNLQHVNIRNEVIGAIPAEVAKRHAVVPINMDDKTLTVATSNPEDLLALDNISFSTGRAVKAVLSTEEDITGALKVHYAKRA